MIQLLIVTLFIGLAFVFWYSKVGTTESPTTVQESRSIIEDAERTVRDAERKANAQANYEINQ